jgi:hypothetical protein
LDGKISQARHAFDDGHVRSRAETAGREPEEQ